jgi:type IV pilus assembly protein PilP
MNTRSVVLLTLLLCGCGNEEMQDLRDFVANAGADMRGKIEPPPEIKPYEAFSYDNVDALPDPFRPRKSEMKNARAGMNQPDFDRPREELEEFPLDTIKMVGFLYRSNLPHAVIRPSDGKLRRIRVGNYLGQNFGKVVSITEAEVKIKEMVQDSAGDWSERESVLQLIEIGVVMNYLNKVVFKVLAAPAFCWRFLFPMRLQRKPIRSRP